MQYIQLATLKYILSQERHLQKFYVDEGHMLDKVKPVLRLLCPIYMQQSFTKQKQKINRNRIFKYQSFVQIEKIRSDELEKKIAMAKARFDS